MGNSGSSGNSRRHHNNHPIPSHPPPLPHPEMSGNRYVFAAATPYPSYPNANANPNPQNYYQNFGYYPPLPPPPPPMPVPLSTPYHGPQLGPSRANWVGGGYPCVPIPTTPNPYVEHQKTVTVKNDVNVMKETLRLEPDEEKPGSFLISFTFSAMVAGRITVMFFAKEDEGYNLTPVKEDLLRPITVSFQQGLNQKFRQPPGTGIDLSVFEESELMKEGDMEVYPIVVKAEASLSDHNGSEGENQLSGPITYQITQAVFEKDKGEYRVRVVKQILSVGGMRYELQEIYGIGNSVVSGFDGNDPGKECVICLSEPRDTTVLPCRHMCMCNGCAKILRFQTNRCPICRQPIERLLEIKVNNRSDD